MKRIKVLVGALACSAVLLSGGSALAANPHFVDGPNFEEVGDSGQQLEVTGRVAGLGKTVGESVDIELTATAARTCTTPSGKNSPKGLKRQVGAEGTFDVEQNGQVSFTLLTEPAGKKCPGKHATDFTYTDIVITLDGEQLYPEL